MNTIHNQSSNGDLLCCRVCLMTDCRLFYIHQYELSEALSRISGSPVYKDQLPQYLCTYCSTLLLKCSSFRDMCLRTEQCLKLELLKGELTTDYIRRIDWPQRLNLTITVAQIVDCVETTPIHIKKEPNEVVDIDDPTINTSAKSKVNKDTDEGNLGESNIDNNDEDNLGGSNIDPNEEDNLSESNIDPNDEDYLGGSNIDDTDEDNSDESNIDEANKDTVDKDRGIQKADTKTELVNKNDKFKTKHNYNEVGDILAGNKAKIVKTYKRNITTTVRKMDTGEDNLGQSIDNNDEDNLGESNKDDTDEGNLGGSNIDDTDEDNLVESNIDPNDEDNLGESNIDPNDEDNSGGSNIDDTDEDNSDESNIDEANKDTVDKDRGIRKADTKTELVNKNDKVKTKHNYNEVGDILAVNKAKIVKTYKRNITTTVRKMDTGEDNLGQSIDNNDEDNLGESNKDDTDEVDLGGSNIEDTDEDNLDESNINEANKDIVDLDCGIQKANTKPELVNKNDKVKNVKIKHNHNEVGDIFSANKAKIVKTYKRNIPTTVRNMDIEIQGHSDKVNENIEKNGAEIDLDAASNYNEKINIRYTGLYYANIKEYIYESDIDDINEIEERIDIVDIDSILKNAVKKKTACTRKIETKVKSKNNCDNPDKLKRAEGQVKKRRRKRKRQFRDPANDNMPPFDISKFESDYAMEIVILSKQEQLEEIALRKQSTNTALPFKCEECGKVYEMEAAYNNHRRRRHGPSAGEHACEICSVRFKLKSIRQKHQDTHRLKFTCKECGFVTRERYAAREHHQVHKGRSFVCQYCGKMFTKRSTYLSHVRLAHPTMNVVCGDCGETFVSEIGLRMHRAMTHSKNMFKCTTCSASFVSLDALNRHTDTGEHSGNPCERCGESCASEEALQVHVGERHPTEAHRCEECRATFSSAAAFDVHVGRKHLDQRYSGGPRARRHEYKNKPAQFVCEQCGHVAWNSALLRYHQNSHLAVKPFPCSQCPKTFSSNGLRKSHERCHKGERPFKCPDCPRAFTAKANFQRHHKVVHLGLHDNAACHACEHVFTTKGSLRLHINSVHNGQPWPKRDRKRKKVASH